MDENKEWIYPEEPIALLSPSVPKVSAKASMPSSPASRRKTAAGLMICVAIFAIAFLLCDAMYAVRQTAVGHETEEWLTQLLAGSFAGAVGQAVLLDDQVHRRGDLLADGARRKVHAAH